MNRATQAQYSPGSSFKPFQALVALKQGAITEGTRYSCSGPGSSPIRCTHHHGSPVSLLNAIEQSCNPYFWHTFEATLVKGGYGDKNVNFRKNYDEWRTNIMKFGFGQKFEDSDIYQQSRGNIPSENYFDKVYKSKTGWRALTIRSLSIGQGEVLVTPLQLANGTAVIANKGFFITPHLNRADSMLTHKHDVGVDPKYFSVVDEGMWRVNEFGTARSYKVPGINWCGKTGTVQNNRGKDHAFYVGYAPRENPKIAIAVVVENAGFGSTFAAPIASLMVEQYLTGKVVRTDLMNKTMNVKTNVNVKEY